MVLNMLIAGFGGQGVLFMGKVAAYTAMVEEKYVPGCLPTARKCAAVRLIAPSALTMSPSVAHRAGTGNFGGAECSLLR